MAVRTGASGALKYEGATVAKCRNWSLDISRDALETTCIGGDDREYVKGLRAPPAQQQLYDPDDAGARALLNSIFDNTRVTRWSSSSTTAHQTTPSRRSSAHLSRSVSVSMSKLYPSASK